MTECPLCFTLLPTDEIERHADLCADTTPANVLKGVSDNNRYVFLLATRFFFSQKH